MKKITYALLFLVVIFGGYFLLNKGKNTSENKKIKIGALLILSGELGRYGEASQKAVQMAIDEYNSDPKNSIKAEVVFEDTKGDPKTSITAYQKLTNLDKVDAIVGPLLQIEAEALYPLIQNDKIPVFMVSVNPIDKRGKTSNPLSVWPDPTLESEQMAQYVYDQGIRKVGILNTRDTWEAEVSDAFSKKFSELGGVITGHEIVLSDSKDTSLPVTKIIASKPEAIYVGTYYKFQYFVKKIKELNFKGPLYSIEIDTSLAEMTNPHSDGLRFISPAFYTVEFEAKYKNLYGQAPSIPVGQAYDATNILLSTLLTSKNYSEVLVKMDKLREFDGVSGKITFTEDHRAFFSLSIFEINKGNLNPIK